MCGGTATNVGGGGIKSDIVSRLEQVGLESSFEIRNRIKQ